MRWLVVLVLLSGVTPSRAADAQPPRLLVERPVFDFGEVDQGVTVEHVFKLRNGGGDPLRIEQVKSTCACTVGAVVGRDVPPKGETWITVQLDTRELAGATTKTITVYSNDPDHPTSGLSLRGVVLADLVVDPPLVYLGTVEAGAATQRTVELRPGRPNGTTRATAVRAPSFLRARLLPDPTSVDRQVLEVGLAPDAPVGQVSGDVVLETTGEREHEIVVPVFGTVRPRPGAS
jgi:Protein of unknown function (DUF1573)